MILVTFSLCLNPLPNDKLRNVFQIETIPRLQNNCDSKLKFGVKMLQNIVGKGVNAGYQHFLLYKHFLLFLLCFNDVSVSVLLKKSIFCGKGLVRIIVFQFSNIIFSDITNIFRRTFLSNHASLETWYDVLAMVPSRRLLNSRPLVYLFFYDLGYIQTTWSSAKFLSHFSQQPCITVTLNLVWCFG